ncbi:MAG TPA: 23S rRNA (adenine(2503)-C(2))-methyltransferase RlmN [bacterium]
MKDNIKKYTLSGLQEKFNELGLERYRGQQVFQWLWQKNTGDFAKMTNLSKDLRALLTERFDIHLMKTEQTACSADGTEKYLFKLTDRSRIESVFIPETKRQTICVSTQAGCAMGCKFCATALLGFKRNLLAHEIAEQVQLVNTDQEVTTSNVVFMGMGEPLHNLTAVEDAVGILSATIGLSISQRHITVSTIGLIEGLRRLIDSPLKAKLAISLNFPDEQQRQNMMPATKKNPLREVLKLAREYSEKKHMVTFEYVVIDGINDRVRDARLLLRLLKNIPSKINLIPYNQHPSLPYKTPTLSKLEQIEQVLMDSKHAVTTRKSRGQEILAGCGQLALTTAGSKEKKTGISK